MRAKARSVGKGAFNIIVFALVLAVPLGDAHAKIYAQWVQLGSDGRASARAITDEAWPSVSLDGVSVTMPVRSQPGQPFGNVAPAQFPVRGCEAAVPPGTLYDVDDKPLDRCRLVARWLTCGQ